MALGSFMMNTMCLQCNVVNIDPCMGHHETVRLDKTGKQGRRKKNWRGQVYVEILHNLPLPPYWNGTGLTNLLRYGEDQPFMSSYVPAALEKRRTVSILPSFYILQNRAKPYLKSHLKLQHDYFM